MDAPFENPRSTTALRLMDIAARRGYDLNVFAYEGAVFLPFARQQPHANAVHGRDVEEENHPLPRKWIAAIMEEAQRNGGKVDWVNYAALPDSPYHQVCQKITGGKASGVLSFGIHGGSDAGA